MIHPSGPIIYEIFKDASQVLYLRIEILENAQPIPILLYRTDGEYKKLMLDGELEFPLNSLNRGAYEVRTPEGAIFRFMLE